ncbi:hypothetical protein QP185_18300 [Sphingomonas aerolata]|uniref:hypothetical protein n=1 Tax=Sphingomonas aerolata TaxID=185951 RepID=UPI002FE3C255
MKLISWATTRTAEAIVDRFADRIATKMKTRIVTTARQRAVAVLPKRGRTSI